MNGLTTPEIDKLRMERRKIEVELNNLEEKVKKLQEIKKAIDNRIVVIKNSETGVHKNFGQAFA